MRTSRRSGLMQRLRKLVFRGFFNTIAGARPPSLSARKFPSQAGAGDLAWLPARRKQPLFHHFRAEQGPMSLSSKAATAAWFLGRPAFWRHGAELVRRKLMRDMDSPDDAVEGTRMGSGAGSVGFSRARSGRTAETRRDISTGFAGDAC